MKAYKPVAVKVCGITRQEDASAAVKAGAELIGFIFHERSPRAMTAKAAAAIDTGQAMRVGVFVDQSLDEVQAIMDTACLHLAQLHGDQNRDFCEALGRQKVMRTFWPERYINCKGLEEDLQRFAPYCRFFLMDAGTSGGGHGQTLDLTLLRELKSPKPYFLAGGLTPENLPDLVRELMPCGVDLNSGVETAPGIKDHRLLQQAVANILVKKSLID